MDLPDTPLSEEALRFRERILASIDERLAEVNKTPVGILLWGPGLDSSNPLATVRLNLRSKLRQIGHAAFYSEELCDPKKPASVRLQQLAQAREFDLIVSLPCTPGSLGEVHDFAADRRVHAKLLIFLNELHLSGYSAQSLQALSSLFSCHLEYYPDENDTLVIEQKTLAEVQRLREIKYILAGRY